MTPIFPAKVSWQQSNTDSMWGPSVHWNTYLESFVMLLNHSCCTTGFPEEGVYVSFAADLSNPDSWTKPKKILSDTGWYPQVIGTEDGSGTDKTAGEWARFFMAGTSQYLIHFTK